MSPVSRRRASTLAPIQVAGLLVLLALGGAVVWVLYPLAFPMAPEHWQVTRQEAARIAEARLSDLGGPPRNAYVTVRLETDDALELRLASVPGEQRERLRASSLGRRLAVWRVSFYQRSSPVGQWSYRAEIALDGEVLSLVRGTPPGQVGSAEIDAATARQRADTFLAEQGIDLSRFAPPVDRRVDLGGFAYRYLRYRELHRELLPISGAGLEYGIEVRFAGEDLEGFYTWLRDAESGGVESSLARAGSIRTALMLAPFLFLPILAWFFVRRYHEGLVPVRRATRLGLLVYGAWLVVWLLASRSAAEGTAVASLSRVHTTWALSGLAVVVYFPALAIVTLMATALGESFAHGTWRARLGTLDALFIGSWRNASVATSALRGVTVGVATAAALLLMATIRAELGAPLVLSQQLGPWWDSAWFPGFALLCVALGRVVLQLALGVLCVVPLLVDRSGLWLGCLGAALVGVLFPAPLTVPSLGGGMVVSMGMALVGIAVFVQWDALSALLALLMPHVLLGALPLLSAMDPGLVFQGCAALLLASLPFWVSLRQLGGTKLLHVELDDIPPHVRRIAERERQRLEIETAQRIQSAILPDLPRRVGSLEVAHFYLSASEVGGDFYSLEALADGRVAIAIGDVAGHGVSSGLMMSAARAAFSVQVRADPSVDRVFEALNRVVFASAGKRSITTLCYALFEPGSRTLDLASAGHLYPYRVAFDGTLEVFESTAYPLGVREHLSIEARSFTLETGDSVLFASDGLVEWRRLGGEEPFGFDRLERALRAAAGRDAPGLRDTLLGDLERFVGSGQRVDLEALPRDDDLTLLVVRLAS